MAKFCINCGNPIEEEDVFCYNCGAKLDSPESVQPEQPRTQSYGDANNQPPQQPPQPQQQQQQQPQQKYIPYQQPAQPYPQYGNRKPPKKKKTALIISLVIVGVVLIAAVVVFLLIFLHKFQYGGKRLPSVTSSVTENVTEAPLEEPTEEPTEKPTENPTEKPATDLPYTDSLGKIENYDFAWISDAMSGNLAGSFLSKDELIGKWKGEFIFDGIWELVYVTIDTDGTVTVQPYKINYGDGWEDESGNPSYDFSGSFDINRVYGDGGYGKIDIYQFIESGNTQYGIGELKTTSGNKAEVYLVRP